MCFTDHLGSFLVFITFAFAPFVQPCKSNSPIFSRVLIKLIVFAQPFLATCCHAGFIDRIWSNDEILLDTNSYLLASVLPSIATKTDLERISTAWSLDLLVCMNKHVD